MDEPAGSPPLEDQPLAGLGPLFLVAPARIVMPPDLFAALEAHVDQVCASPDRVSDAHKLAGRIRRGEQVNAFAAIPPEVALFICASARHYIGQIAALYGTELKPDYQVAMQDSWIVKQQDGDYNPMHHHAGDLSGIIYVRVPDQVSDPKVPDGKLSFFHGQYKLSNLDLLGVREVVPRRGELFIFPAWLQHSVYPFSGDGERVSYSFNLGAKGLVRLNE